MTGSVRELGKQLRTGKTSARELMEATLVNINKRERFNSFITRIDDEALKLADERDKELKAGRDRGPFHGIPIAHKDNFFTRGVRTTGGSLLYRDFVPETDADAVTRLAEAGAISVGKTNMHELAYGITSKNPHYGFVLNPHDPSRIAGGSSGGSAALVAAGLIPLATGTDTGGSLRIPGSYCGVVGFKPTFGRVSVASTIPLSFSLDTIGVMGGCIDDCALAFEVLAGEPAAERLPDLHGVRVGVPRREWFQGLDGDVESAVENAIAIAGRLGAEITVVETPSLREMNTVARVVQMAETAALYHDRADSEEFGADVWALLQQGRQITGFEYVNAQRLRTQLRLAWDALWQNVTVMLIPATPIVAPPIAEDTVTIHGVEEDVRLLSTKLVRCFNLSGEPALSMPCGAASNGMPIGLQVVAAPYADARLLQVAQTLEERLTS